MFYCDVRRYQATEEQEAYHHKTRLPVYDGHEASLCVAFFPQINWLEIRPL